MPEIQKLYEEYSEEEDPSVIILGIAAPNYSNEGSEEEIIAFLEEQGYTYPVVMDTTAEMFRAYGIYSYPTTFMIDADGNLFGYISGQLSEMMMRSIIEQTVTGVRYSTDTQS
jgi:cytochrome c-type biogenesis protein